MSLRLGEEFKPIALEGEEGLALGPLTFMETASTEIYSALEDIMDFQTRFRMVRLHNLPRVSQKYSEIIINLTYNFSKKHKDEYLLKKFMSVYYGGR